MRRATFIRILSGIKLVSNNVSSVENFNNKSLITVRVPEIVGDSPKKIKSFLKVLSYCSYYSIMSDGKELLVTLEFQWEQHSFIPMSLRALFYWIITWFQFDIAALFEEYLWCSGLRRTKSTQRSRGHKSTGRKLRASGQINCSKISQTCLK